MFGGSAAYSSVFSSVYIRFFTLASLKKLISVTSLRFPCFNFSTCCHCSKARAGHSSSRWWGDSWPSPHSLQIHDIAFQWDRCRPSRQWPVIICASSCRSFLLLWTSTFPVLSSISPIMSFECSSPGVLSHHFCHLDKKSMLISRLTWLYGIGIIGSGPQSVCPLPSLAR